MSSLLALASPVLMSAGAVALPVAANALLQRLRLRRVLPLMRRVFTVLDPLLTANLATYRGSDVQFVAQLLTTVLADGQLSPAEVRLASEEILRRWSPAVAAGRTPERLLDNTTEQRLFKAVDGLMSKGGYSLNSLGEAVFSIKQAIR